MLLKYISRLIFKRLGGNMKNMYKVIFVSAAVMLFANGCVSHMVMEGSKKQIAMQRAVISGDDVAIKAIRLGDNGVGVGIDISNLDAILERPLLQIGAALSDAALIYAAREIVDAIERGLENDSKSEDNTKSYVEINGDGNDVVIIDGYDNDSNAVDEDAL